jgi:hypothetical protein
MKLRSKLFALVGAGALVLGIAGTAFADGSVTWTGNGTSTVDGHKVLNAEQCDTANTPYLFWVLSPADGITSAELWVNGQDEGAMTAASDNGNAAYQLQTDWFDLDSLTASAVVTGGNDNAKLKISHGCAGEETSTTSFTSSESSESTSTTSFTSSESSESTVVPSEPNTATIGTAGTSTMSNGLWMLLAGIGVVGGSILVLMPARAKGKR